jgi:hypothetical protein
MEVKQVGGTTLFGKTLTGTPSTALPQSDNVTNDARFDPIYSTSNIPQLNLLSVNAESSGSNVLLTLKVSNLDDLTPAFAATNAGSLDYVVRWTGPAINDPTDGIRNPIYYAAAEATPVGTFAYFAGQAVSVELCSVSGCSPHIVDYPAPPRGGTAVTGTIVHRATYDLLKITVPRSAVDNLQDGQLLESLSAYSFARDGSAAVTLTNAEGEAGVTPIEIDGICCEDVALAP